MDNYISLFLLCFAVQAFGCSGVNSQDGGTVPQSASGRGSVSGFTGEKLRLIGRFDLSVKGDARFTWPASALEFRFEGTAARIGIAARKRVRFQVTIDDRRETLWVTKGDKIYPLVVDLKPGPHRVRITRLSESSSGVSAFTSDPIVKGRLLRPPQPPDRRLLVLGDSITTGYGVEGESETCGYSMETSNPLKAYAALAANALDADLHILAWSGIGARRFYGEQTPQSPTIIDRYRLTLADDFNSDWNPADYVPDAILVNIGTNDYWDGEAPGYRSAMERLLRTLRDDYPAKPVYLIVSAMLSGSARQAQTTLLKSLANESVSVLDLGRIQASEGFGCDYHPNTQTQTRMADALVERLRSDLGWR